MSNARRDGNFVPAMQGVSSVDGSTPTDVWVNPLTHAVLIDSTSLYSGLDTRYATVSQATPQTIGSTGSRLTKLWATDITVTNAITGSITGNAGTVTNGVYTNAANSMSLINPLTTIAESWIGPSSTTGIYFKGGNVGIGTTGPATKLDVVGLVRSQVANNSVAFRAINTANANRVFYELQSDADGDGQMNMFNLNEAQTILLHTNGNSYINGGNLGIGYADPGTAKLAINGNVGIGTTAPGKKVEINSATGDCLRLTYNDADGSAVNYTDFAVSSSGDLTITPSGGDLFISGAGSTVIGSQSALATTATTGFVYIPTSAGTPTGVPTTYTGKVAMEYDTTANKLWVYNGAWKSVTLA